MKTLLAADAHVLVAGISARAMADSAARAGFRVTSIDAFADLDHHASVRALAVTGTFTAHAAAGEARDVSCDAVAYLSSFENHPDAVQALASGRMLLGNRPEVLASVRNPHLLADALSRCGIPVPLIWGDGDGPWLLKPLASGGGHGIGPWQRGAPVPEGHYVQEFIDGQSGSVVFVASPEGIRVLGVFQQLVGLEAFGASGYRYCGSILDGTMAPGSWMLRGAATIARAVTEAFGLIGINGVDFVARGGALYPVEINPRWSASVELVERAHGISAFAAHAEACTTGVLPAFDAVTAASIGRTIGKAVIFAQHEARVGDTTRWWPSTTVRDVPRPFTHINRGEPICTVFAEGATPEACRAALEQQAAQIHREVRTWAGAA